MLKSLTEFAMMIVKSDHLKKCNSTNSFWISLSG